MKKIITRRLFIYMLAAFLVTITAIFALQTFISKRNNVLSSQNKLEDVKEKLFDNDENVERLTENLGENNLAKTRAFADMLAADKTIFGNMDKLNEIKERLMVNELHIIDADGIITSSTIPEYIGFDMKSGEQSNAFMVIVDDPSIEIVQEPQVNVAEGIVMQYIGVARSDDKGLVQVGVRPEVLENTLASTAIDVVLKDIDFGETGYVYAIDSEGMILAHKDASLLGASAASAGFPQNLTGSGRAVINGEKGYYYKLQLPGAGRHYRRGAGGDGGGAGTVRRRRKALRAASGQRSVPLTAAKGRGGQARARAAGHLSQRSFDPVHQQCGCDRGDGGGAGQDTAEKPGVTFRLLAADDREDDRGWRGHIYRDRTGKDAERIYEKDQQGCEMLEYR